MENFTFNQLYYFYKLAQTLNYHVAAEELYISQPALSKQIKDLESIIGVKLFKKHGRNIVLSEAGSEFVIYVGQILQMAQKSSQAMKRFNDSNNPYFKVGISGSQILYSTLDTFNQRFPNANLNIQECRNTEIIERIKSHQLDAGITFLPINDEALASKYIFSDEVVAVVSKTNSAFHNKKETTMKELAKFPIATLKPDFYFRKLLDHYLQNHLILSDYRFELNAYGSCINIIKNNDAVTLVPKSFLNSEAHSNIKALKIKDGIMPIKMGLTYLKEDNLASPINELYNALVQKLR